MHTPNNESDLPIWDQDGYLTVKQFAAYAAMGESTVRHLCSDGKISFARFGNSIRIPKSELKPDEESQQEENQEEENQDD